MEPRLSCKNGLRVTTGPVMMTFSDHLFKLCHFWRMIISMYVRWYVSYWELAEMMAEKETKCMPHQHESHHLHPAAERVGRAGHEHHAP